MENISCNKISCVRITESYESNCSKKKIASFNLRVVPELCVNKTKAQE